MKPYEPAAITDIQRFYEELGIPMPTKLKRVTVDPYSGYVFVKGCSPEECANVAVQAEEFFARPEAER